MPRVTSADGTGLHVETAGTGPRLLVISGTGGDLRTQPWILEGPLAARFEVAAYDQRGLGRSDVPTGPYTMADYGNDAGAVLAALGWGPALVLGVSFGGMVAQELAIRFPAAVRRLVLACTSSGGAGGASYPLHELADLPVEERLARMVPLTDVRCDEAWRAANPAEWEGTVALLRGYERGDGPAGEGLRLQLGARARHDTWARLGAIGCPTLVCGGRHDGIAPEENSRRLAASIPGSTLELFDGGHGFLWQDPSALPAVVGFLTR